MYLPINHEQNKDLQCPHCQTLLVKRAGRYGEFYGCKNYPKCKFTCSIDYEEREMAYDSWLRVDEDHMDRN